MVSMVLGLGHMVHGRFANVFSFTWICLRSPKTYTKNLEGTITLSSSRVNIFLPSKPHGLCANLFIKEETKQLC